MTELIRMLFPLAVFLLISDSLGLLLAGRIPAAWIALLTSAAVLPYVLWLRWRDKEKTFRVFPGTFRLLGMETWAGIGCLLAGAGMNALLSGLLDLLRLKEAFPDTAQRELLAAGLPLCLAALVVAVPVAEELVFRGLVYPRMRESMTPFPAAVLNAALFAVTHGNVVQGLFAFPMGLLLCLLCEKSGCLIYPILFHAGCNLAAVLFPYP